MLAIENNRESLPILNQIRHINRASKPGKRACIMTIRRARNSEWQKELTLVSYAILNHASKNEKVHTIVVGNTRSN